MKQTYFDLYDSMQVDGCDKNGSMKNQKKKVAMFSE